MKHQPIQDYTQAPVPDNATINGFRIAIVLFGIGITLPVFYVGSQVAQSLGFRDGLIAMIGGCLIVGAMMAITSIVGARTRLTTYVILQFSFGRYGARIVNLMMAVTLLGYFAATADIFGEAVADLVASYGGPDLPKRLYTLLGCAFMSLTALFGFRWVARFSDFAVPVLALFMVYVVYVTLQDHQWNALAATVGDDSMSLGAAISAIVGANILMAVSGPDFARYAKDRTEALKSVTGLVIGFPVVMLASGIPSLATGEVDIMKIMINLGVGTPAFVILVFATWTTNTINLYSAGLTLATIFPETPELKTGIVAASIATAAALAGFMDFFLPFVLFLGIATTPLAGIYLADYVFIRSRVYDVQNIESYRSLRIEAVLAWLMGSGIAALTTYGSASISTVPALDALLTSFVSYLALSRIIRRRRKLQVIR